jgi:hypothetical protein
MPSNRPRTWYAKLTRIQTLVVLAVFTASISWCIIKCENVTSLDIANLSHELDDSGLYSSVAARVGTGENYYDAAADELVKRGYPTASVFNWRMPIYAWIFGKLPSPSWGETILVLFTSVAIGMVGALADREGGWKMQLAVGLVLVGSYAWLIYPEPIYFMELWSGLFITISLCFYVHGEWKWGVLSGTIALILRELALPYCAIAFALAWRRHRVKEVFIWIIIILLYLTILYMHYNEIRCRTPDIAATRDLGWIAFGGTPFVLSTCRMNFPLMLLPSWCTAVYLPLSLLGLFGLEKPDALPIKLTAIVYILFFSFVGKPYDFYWGWLYMPLLASGFAWSLVALRDLVTNVINGPRQS